MLSRASLGTISLSRLPQQLGAKRRCNPIHRITPWFTESLKLRRASWIGKWTLCSFSVLFFSLASSLILIWYYVRINGGFVLSITRSHYAWTYGPTAILTIVLSLWRQLDYCCRVTQPWQEMQHTFTPACRSVLLDYVWPLQTTSLYRACIHRHWAVIASTCGHLLLKLIIIISTTLFVLQSHSFLGDTNATILNEFDTGDFWSSIEFSSLTEEEWSASISSGVYYNISAASTWSYMNYLDNGDLYSQSLDSGRWAYQDFSVTSNETERIEQLSAQVDIFVPNTLCNVAKSSYEWRGDSLSLTLATPNCSMGYKGLINSSGELYDQQQYSFGFCLDTCPVSSLIMSIIRVNCSWEGIGGTFEPSVTTDNVYKYAFVAADVTMHNVTVEGETYSAATGSKQITSVFCDFRYDISKGIVTKIFADGLQQLSVQTFESSPRRQLKFLNNLQFSELIFSSLLSGRPSRQSNNYAFSDSEVVNNFFDLMAIARGDSTSYEPFLDGTILASTAQTVMNGISTKLVQEIFSRPANSNVSAAVRYTEQRLQIRTSALWPMVAILITMTVLPMVIMASSKVDVALKHSDLPVSSLLLTARSESLNIVLENCGASRGSQLRHFLEDVNFKMAEHNLWKIQAAINTSTKKANHVIIESCNWADLLKRRKADSSGQKQIQQDIRSKKDWMPYPARRHAAFFTVFLPILLVSALEMTSQLTNNTRHSIILPNDSSVESYAIRYCSTLILLGVATLYNNLDFATAALAPFSILRNGSIESSRSLNINLLGKLPPLAFHNAIVHQHKGAALSAMASFIGSLLTVIVSGLWVADTFNVVTGSVTAVRANSWDVMGYENQTNDNGAAALFNRIQHGSAIIPDLVHRDLVLTEITGTSFLGRNGVAIKDDGVARNATFVIPVLRPTLFCESVPASSLSINYTYATQDNVTFPYAADLRAVAKLPDGCLRRRETGRDDLDLNHVLMKAGSCVEANRTIRFGELDVIYIEVQTNNDTKGCPSIGAIMGQYGPEPGASDKFLAVLCYQRIEQLEAQITYTGNSSKLRVDKSVLPIIDDKSITALTNTTNDLQSLIYNFRRFEDEWATIGEEKDRNSYDTFFQHLILGPDGVPFDELLHSEGTTRLASAMDDLYKRYMIHVINLNFRVPIAVSDTTQQVAANKSSSDDVNSTTTGRTITGSTREYVTVLKINKASKVTLQVMLGTMAILGSLVYIFTDIRGTLPRSPCSIASMAALFAGSELHRRVSQALKTSNCTDPTDCAEVRHILDEEVLSLGWWDVDQKTPVAQTDNAVTEDRETEPTSGEARHSTSSKDDETDDPEITTVLKAQTERFGIDLGSPNRLGYSAKGGWRQRIPWPKKSKSRR